MALACSQPQAAADAQATSAAEVGAAFDTAVFDSAGVAADSSDASKPQTASPDASPDAGLADAKAADGKPVTQDAVADSPAAETSACAVKPTLESLEKEYFAGSCAFSSCHSAAKHAGELVLEPGLSYANLIGIPALHPGAVNFVRVDPGKPDDSFLYIKVTQPQAGQGKLMPVGASEPVDADCGIAALKAWIAAGAKK